MLLLLAAIIYAGKLANHHTTPKPLGEVRRGLMQNAIEDAHVLMEMVGEG